MIDTPKLSFPFAPGAYREQDSSDEVMDCVEVLLSTEEGERTEIPLYGIPDQAFRQNGLDVTRVLGVLDRWEPRASATIERQSLKSLVDSLLVKVTGGSGF